MANHLHSVRASLLLMNFQQLMLFTYVIVNLQGSGKPFQHDNFCDVPLFPLLKCFLYYGFKDL